MNIVLLKVILFLFDPLFSVLRRLVTSISNTASLEANCESMKKQAESANAMAKQLMEEKDNKVTEEELVTFTILEFYPVLKDV